MVKTAGELATRLGGTLYGNRRHPFTVLPVRTAGSSGATFLLDEFADRLGMVQADLVLMAHLPDDRRGKNILVVDNPKLAATAR